MPKAKTIEEYADPRVSDPEEREQGARIQFARQLRVEIMELEKQLAALRYKIWMIEKAIEATARESAR